MNEIYESFSGYLTEDSKKFLVAFSGGLDSTVLLYALKQALVKEKLNKEILAIHVDHKPVSYTHLTLPTITGV